MASDLCGFEQGELVRWNHDNIPGVQFRPLLGRVIRAAEEPGVLIVAFRTRADLEIEMLCPAARLTSLTKQEASDGE